MCVDTYINCIVESTLIFNFPFDRDGPGKPERLAGESRVIMRPRGVIDKEFYKSLADVKLIMKNFTSRKGWSKSEKNNFCFAVDCTGG